MSSGESEGGNNGGSNETGVQQDNRVLPPLNLRLTKTPELINSIQSHLYPLQTPAMAPTLEEEGEGKGINLFQSHLYPWQPPTMPLTLGEEGEGKSINLFQPYLYPLQTPAMALTLGEEGEGKGSFEFPIMDHLGNVLLLEKEPEITTFFC
ncbi:hypothetical protein AALP_AA2G022500 [Arabis alpina]|uniref:Uncharacterized protein n=1 Tax=Arabis alpina TaxID=50452 RepID=A0A087HET4_ARAAL|nr:hypothetical protein AALP_AA2G022500 [Arabis alpina]